MYYLIQDVQLLFLIADVGIELDVMNGKPKRMYGVGGYSEPCYEQEITNINIDRQQLDKVKLPSVESFFISH